jgi:hypothetical protein
MTIAILEYCGRAKSPNTVADQSNLPVWRRLRIFSPQPWESWKAKKKEPGACGYNWANLSLADLNTGTWSSRLVDRLKADDLAL